MFQSVMSAHYVINVGPKKNTIFLPVTPSIGLANSPKSPSPVDFLEQYLATKGKGCVHEVFYQ